MLARDHRIVTGANLRSVQRRGQRRVTEFFVMPSLPTSEESPSRFGFVVSKSVGGAVVRNLVKRRLRYLAAEALRIHPVGADVVVRALAPAATADFDQLRAAWNQATSKASSR